jgi:hypothetical protein
VLVLVNDEEDRRLQAATFEQLLGLPDGALTPGALANTSLSMERIELCRQVNLAVEARGWVGSRTLNTPRRAMLTGLRSAPLRDFESRIPALPSWTGPRLVELSDERARTVAGSGVRVIGDPDLLRYTPDPDAPDLSEPPSVLPTEAAANAIEHALAGMLRRQERQERQGRQERRARPRAVAASPSPPVDPLTRVTSRAMLREVARRQRARLRRGGTSGRTGRGDPRDRSDP